MKTQQELSDWALWVFDSKWLYGMGCYGQRLQTIYPILAKSWYYTVKNPEGFKKLTEVYNTGANPRLYDCHGIVDGFRMDDDTTVEIEFDPSVDTSADYEMARVKATGTLGKDYGPIDANMLDNAGYGYWKEGHFGVGVGNGLVVDIWSTGYPARKRDQTLGNWTNWLKCYGIYYGGEEMAIYKDCPDGQPVYSYQVICKKLGCAVGTFYDMVLKDATGQPLHTGCDGSYGPTMLTVTNDLERKYGLPVTANGLVSDVLYGKLNAALQALITGVPQAQYDAVVKQRDAALAQVTTLTAQVNALTAKTKELETEIFELNIELQSAKDANIKLTEQLDETKTALAKAQKDLADAQKTIKDASDAVQVLLAL